MYEIARFPDPLIYAEHPGIVQIGIIRFPQDAKCTRCRKPGVEMVIMEKGKNLPYHWKCLKKRRRFIKSKLPAQMEAGTGADTLSENNMSAISED